MIYKENMLIQIENEKFRIIDYDKNRDNLCVINMNKKCSMPFTVSAHEIQELFNKGEIKEIGDNSIYANKKLLDKRDFYYQIICFMFSKNEKNELYYKDTRASIINKAIEKFHVSYSTIKRILCIYLQSGKIRNSLVDNLQNCGGKGKDRIIKNRKNGVVIDNNIKKLFKEGINKYYNTSKKNSIKMCYELIIRDYLKEDKDRQIPTFKQFYYWYNKFSKENKKSAISKRYGERIYQQTSRAIIGNSIQDTLAPSDLYQIDSTILDVYIVSKLNRNLIIGRPVLYLIIDTYSRMIVGMNVTIEAFNSYTGVQGALINAMTDKVSFCKRFDIDIKNEEWDVSCIPNRILADRGELLSADIENAVVNLGIMIQNTPPYRGDMKGIVEKSFERIHSYIKPFVDGVVENKFNKVERGAKDYRLKANLTLYEITQIIIKCILFHNNHNVIEYYESDGLTIETSIPKIPCKLWEYGIKQKKGLLRELSEEVIKINLLSNKEVTVTAKGVRFNKLFYVSKWSLEEGWYQRARIEGTFKIKVSYSYDNVGEIYYIKKDGMSYDTLTLVTYMEQYRDLSEEELIKVFEYQQKMNNDASEKEIREKVALFDEIEKITNKAKEEQERSRDKTISKTQRLKNIRQNLADEFIRLQLLQKIYKVFQSLPIHLKVWTIINTLIMQGYVDRNPFNPKYRRHINKLGNNIINHDFSMNVNSNYVTTASCGLIIGFSGMGKTTIVNKVLENIPQVICHSRYNNTDFNNIQVTWIKLEAPHNSSLKALTLQFFMKIDKLIGTENMKRYAVKNLSVDAMLPIMGQLANNVGLGLLIIDELQHMNKNTRYI